jgi:hypothetical protein
MSNILPHKVEQIDAPYVVACEGYGDICLISKLLECRGIRNCSVGCPSRTGVGGDGKDYLPKYLDALALAAAKESPQTMKGLLIVIDADKSPQTAFAAACSAFRYAGFVPPDRPFAPKVEQGLKTAVYTIPGPDESGTLEDLLLRSSFEKFPAVGACIDSFLACTGNPMPEDQNTVAKMKMSALVASSHPANPWATPGPLLLSHENKLVPFDSPHFKHLADFLKEFCSE